MGKKRFLSIILCAVTAISLAACSAQKQQAADSNATDYVYIPEYITMSDEDNSNYSNLNLKGNTLYYTQYRYDESTMTSSELFCQRALDDGSEKQIALPVSDERGISSCTVDESGNIYALFYDYSAEKMSAEGFMIADMFIGKYDEQGNALYEKDITAAINKVSQDSYINGMAVDAQGNIYLSVEDSILLFDTDGEEQGLVSIGDGWINSLGMGKDGKVYLSYYDYTSNEGGMVLSEIDYAGKKLGATYKNLPNMNGNGWSVGITKDFLVQDGSKVYEYELATESYEELFSWLDCDINGSYVSYVGATADGNIVAVINDWDTDITELVKLSKKDASEVVQKEEVVIGMLYDNQQLQAAAVAFNKANDKYRVVIKTYLDTNNWGADSYSTALTNLQNDIVSGTNCPDIIDLSQLEQESALAEKGVFEDLTPYLEKSSVISKEDFLDSVLEGFSYDGKLYSIPATVNLQTLVGKTSVVGDKVGWSLDEMMRCIDNYPDAELLEGYQKDTVLYVALMFSESSFVNWQKGECYFNTDDFKKVLEYANRFPSEYDWANYDGSGEVEKMQNNAVLLTGANIYDLQEIQVYEAKFGEPVTFVGYPTADGSAGCAMYADARYGIISKADNKEGAWEFIENYLASSVDSRYSWGIPTMKERFEEMITEATTPDYILDENGDPVLDENGEAMVAGSASMSSDGWEYTYHTPTKEDAQILRDLLAVAKPMATLDTELLNIITEEVEPYFAGEKSLDEVADIVQSRAQIYISENS